MISLASEMTDSKGRHARGWLFYDAECDFCTRIVRFLARPMWRRQLGIAPLQDPRVTSLLGMPPRELLLAVRYLSPEGIQYSGADAFLALAIRALVGKAVDLLFANSRRRRRAACRISLGRATPQVPGGVL